jgi:hypothetical protein
MSPFPEDLVLERSLAATGFTDRKRLEGAVLEALKA